MKKSILMTAIAMFIFSGVLVSNTFASWTFDAHITRIDMSSVPSFVSIMVDNYISGTTNGNTWYTFSTSNPDQVKAWAATFLTAISANQKVTLVVSSYNSSNNTAVLQTVNIQNTY